MIHDRNGRCCSRANRWRASRDAHMAIRWFLWFWLRACGTHTPAVWTLPIVCKYSTMVEWSQFMTFASSRVHWCGSLWINVSKRSSSNPEGLPERGVSLMSKRSSLKRENPFLAVLFSMAIVPIHDANVSGRLRCFRPFIELKEKNMSEMFQFLHFSLHFLASTVPLTIFKWQIFNMGTQAQQLNFK